LITPKLYSTRLLTFFNGAGGARPRICQGEKHNIGFRFLQNNVEASPVRHREERSDVAIQKPAAPSDS
jgi:hypothetical protein